MCGILPKDSPACQWGDLRNFRCQGSAPSPLVAEEYILYQATCDYREHYRHGDHRGNCFDLRILGFSCLMCGRASKAVACGITPRAARAPSSQSR